tara:strand:- start:663 stop:938 length:276 start_codon:yes stop_codon:yes gene_type:complete
MKQLISATLSKEAADIYNSWPKQKKSEKISVIICDGDSYLKRVVDLQEGINLRNKLISRVMWELKDQKNYQLLLDDLNEALLGTLNYQYRD